MAAAGDKKLPLGKLLQKALRPNEEWTEDDLLDAVHWIRQPIALIAGIVLGCVGIGGIVGILALAAANVVGTYLYFRWLNADGAADDDVLQSVMKEGLMPSFALSVLIYVMTYNVFHV